MIRFTLRGDAALLTGLAPELSKVGTETSDEPALILIGATTLAEATSQLDAVFAADRTKVLIVGLDEEWLEYYPNPPAGSYGAFLEDFEILGVMPGWLAKGWLNSGFIGKMATATKLGLWYGGPAHSPTYAIWAGLNDFPDAAAFLVRLVALAESDRSTE